MSLKWIEAASQKAKLVSSSNTRSWWTNIYCCHASPIVQLSTTFCISAAKSDSCEERWKLNMAFIDQPAISEFPPCKPAYKLSKTQTGFDGLLVRLRALMFRHVPPLQRGHVNTRGRCKCLPGWNMVNKCSFAVVWWLSAVTYHWWGGCCQLVKKHLLTTHW